jgi:hypothetical protein
MRLEPALAIRDTVFSAAAVGAAAARSSNEKRHKRRVFTVFT